MRVLRPFLGPVFVAGAMLLDGLRRPLPWAAAGGAGLAAMSAALFLPAAGEEDRARIAATLTAGLLFFLVCTAGALLPASALGSRRSDGVLASWSALPGGRAGSFAGCFLASCAALGLWAAFLLCAQIGVVGIACRALEPGRNPLAARREIRPENPGAGASLAPGRPASWRFPPADSRRAPPGDLEGEAAVRLFLARPDSREYGTPLAVRVRGARGLPRLEIAAVSAVRGRSVAFRVPAPYVAQGFELEIEQGASCFDAEVPAGGVVLFGRSRSPGSNLAAAGLSALLAALFVALLSGAASAFVSPPVAVALAAAAALAGILSEPASIALRDWERTGLLHAKEGVPGLPFWFGPYKSGLGVLLQFLPGLGDLNRAGDLAEGRVVDAASVLRAGLKPAAAGVALFLAAWIFHARTRRDE